MPKIFALIIALLPLAFASYRKAIVFTKGTSYINLGNFTITGDSSVRSLLIVRGSIITNQQPDLYLVSYTLDNWELVDEPIDCENLLERPHNTLQIPMNNKWMNSVEILFPHPTMHLIATNCFSPYVTNIQGRPIELEITECTFEEPIEDEPIIERIIPPTITNDTNDTNSTETDYFEYILADSSFNKLHTPSLVILIISLVIGLLIGKEKIIYGFYFLILAIISRILMELLIIFNGVNAEFTTMDKVIVASEIVSQAIFIINCAMMTFMHTNAKAILAIISTILVGGMYYFLFSSTVASAIFGIRSGMFGLIFFFFIYGILSGRNNNAFNIIGLFMGSLYLIFIAIVEVTLTNCSGSDSILKNKIILILDYQLCSDKRSFLVNCDFVIQAIIMGLTTIISSVMTNKD